MVVLQGLAYHKNQTIIKVFGSGDTKKIKVITLNALRCKGIETLPEFSSVEAAQKYSDLIDAVSPDIQAIKDFIDGDAASQPAECMEFRTQEKMRESKSRARAVIFDLAFCNNWDWFFTGTLDKTKYNRSDLNKFHHDITQWFRNYSRLKGLSKIDFLLIPELHKDGVSWHMHGLLAGLPVEHLHQFILGDSMGAKLASKVRSGDLVFNWPAYQKKFGFCDLERVKNSEAVSKYCCKYITKSLQHSVKESGAHLYYHSRGLRRSEVVAVGSFGGKLPPPDFSNDFCSVVWLPYSPEVLSDLTSAILGDVRYSSRGSGFAFSDSDSSP